MTQDATAGDLLAREVAIAAWLAEGHDRLLAHARVQLLCDRYRGAHAGTGMYGGGMFTIERWRRSHADIFRSWWQCRVCFAVISEVERMAPDPRLREHEIDHCETWLAEHRYVVPGRFADRDVLGDALTMAFGSFVR